MCTVLVFCKRTVVSIVWGYLHIWNTLTSHNIVSYIKLVCNIFLGFEMKYGRVVISWLWFYFCSSMFSCLALHIKKSNSIKPLYKMLDLLQFTILRDKNTWSDEESILRKQEKSTSAEYNCLWKWRSIFAWKITQWLKNSKIFWNYTKPTIVFVTLKI